MIIIFIIFFTLILIEILILGVIFSKVSIKIYELKIYGKKTKNEIEDIVGEIDVLLFKFIKFLKIRLYTKFFSIFGIKIKYNRIFKYINYDENDEIIFNNLKTFLYYLKNTDYNRIDLKIEKIDLNIDLGFRNPIITSLVTTSISSILPFLVRKYMKTITDDNFKYIINSNYFNISNYKINVRVLFNFNLYLVIREALYYKHMKDVILDEK